VYNAQTNATAYIEDRYLITLPPTVVPSTDAYISEKFKFVTDHLERAMDPGPIKDSLFVTFASAAYKQDERGELVMYPVTYALGEEGGVKGVNARLRPWLEARKGGRFGIISK